MSIQVGDASHRRVSPLTNSGLLPSVHFCTKWSFLACAFFLPSFLQPVPRCSQTVAPARKPRSLLGNIAKGAAASPNTPASASSTSAASGHQWNFCETWQQNRDKESSDLQGNSQVRKALYLFLCCKIVSGVTQRGWLPLKGQKETRLVEWKVHSILNAGNLPVQRLTPSTPHQQSMGKHFQRQREGAPCRNSTVCSDSQLVVGHQWSDQCHCDCSRYS